ARENVLTPHLASSINLLPIGCSAHLGHSAQRHWVGRLEDAQNKQRLWPFAVGSGFLSQAWPHAQNCCMVEQPECCGVSFSQG
ncbi:hypothetical protein LEMLEM_LOCUS4654, partial [Lemmus lemmus]